MSFVNKLKKKENLPYLFMLILLIVVHYFINTHSHDDLVYQRFKNTNTIIGLTRAVISRYNAWSARVIIEFVLFAIVKYSWLWKALNIAMYFLLAYSFDCLLPKTEHKLYRRFAICSLLLLYPLGNMSSAGWAATTTGYLWTITLGAYAISLCKRIIEKDKLKKWEYVCGGLATLYASNHEQMAVILIGIYIMLLVIAYLKKTGKIFITIQLFISVIDLIFMYMSPAESLRSYYAACVGRPDCNNVPFVKLLYEAYAGTMNYFLDENNILFIMLTIMLYIVVIKSKCSVFYKIVSIFPTLIIGLFAFDSTDFGGLSRRVSELRVQDIVTKKNYLPIVVATMVLTVIIASLYMLLGNTIIFWSNFVILGLSMGSRIGTGLTGSAYGSATRTASFIEFAICYSILSVMFKNEKLLNKKWINCLLIILVVIVNVVMCHNLYLNNGEYI